MSPVTQGSQPQCSWLRAQRQSGLEETYYGHVGFIFLLLTVISACSPFITQTLDCHTSKWQRILKRRVSLVVLQVTLPWPEPFGSVHLTLWLRGSNIRVLTAAFSVTSLAPSIPEETVASEEPFPEVSFPRWLALNLLNSLSPLSTERLLLNHANTPGFLAPGGEEFNLGPETRLDRSELLSNKVLLKYKGDRESFWHRHQKGAERVPPC